MTILEESSHIQRPDAAGHPGERMEALGHLAVGVAHDFNNLLTVILGYSEMLNEQLVGQRQALELVGEIHKAGIQAERMTQRLLAFARHQALAPRVLNLGAVVLDCDKMIRRLAGDDIDVTLNVAADLGAVKMDPAQVQQIIMNLVVNARDAMPRGGQLTIDVANAAVAPVVSGDVDVVPGGFIMLRVQDTGIGMSAAIRARIFEPFFTTKEPGKGTGLGLATIDDIVKELCGHIDVESELGHGSTFTIYLPQVQESVDMDAMKADERRMLAGHEVVLLVDDEDSVRQFTAQVLQTCGYTVLSAANGQEALEIAKVHAGEIDLLVSDMAMPGLGGPQLAERLLIQCPHLKVLFVSGHGSDSLAPGEITGSNTAFLQKPFSVSALSRRVRDLLDRPEICTEMKKVE